MKILEDFGIKKIRQFYSRMDTSEPQKYSSVLELFASNYIYRLSFLAFLIGFVCTLPVIWLELELNIFDMDSIEYLNIAIYSISLIVLVAIEFYMLFVLGFYAISYYIFHLNYLEEIETIHLKEDEFLAIFSRVIMELPQPTKTKHNIRHDAIDNIDIMFLSLLYKLKVVVSNFFLKFILKRVLTRSSFRGYAPYIATIGTGLWDGVVFFKTVREAQYKIMIRYTIDYLLRERADLFLDEYNVKAVLSRYYYYGEYSNNFEYLLDQISSYAKMNYPIDDYLDERVIRESNQKLLLLLFCFKEKFYNSKERKIIGTIKNREIIMKLKKALKSGKTEEIQVYIDGI
ncbi:MAG: hypothetical protein DRG30_04220 [Epsilonproteobacteria bacterium]|nr:MAG: hypothetical protein DRG30_04220 [Campylobacterota bacterium]